MLRTSTNESYVECKTIIHSFQHIEEYSTEYFKNNVQTSIVLKKYILFMS